MADAPWMVVAPLVTGRPFAPPASCSPPPLRATGPVAEPNGLPLVVLGWVKP